MSDAHIWDYHRWRMYALTEGLVPDFWNLPGYARWLLLRDVGRRMQSEGMFA